MILPVFASQRTSDLKKRLSNQFLFGYVPQHLSFGLFWFLIGQFCAMLKPLVVESNGLKSKIFS